MSLINDYRRPRDLRNEEFIAIDVWNDQVGEWINVDEAKSIADAEHKIAGKLSNLDYIDSTYSIVVVKREVFNKG